MFYSSLLPIICLKWFNFENSLQNIGYDWVCVEHGVNSNIEYHITISEIDTVHDKYLYLVIKIVRLQINWR